MTTRTLRHWARHTPRPLGRPPQAPVVRWRISLQVARTLRIQGWTTGWRPVVQALPQYPVRLIQQSVTALKIRHQARVERHRVQARQSVTVLATHAVVVQDATHLGRVGARAVQAEILKDRATLVTIATAVGAAATSEEVLRILEKMKSTTGLPLVWGTDNGPAYRADAVEVYLVREQVVHLRSQPHTPQDNAAAERGIGELKAEAGLGRGTRFVNEDQAIVRLETARRTLNHGRLRASKGYRTSAQLAVALPPWYATVSRETFYARVQQVQEALVHDGLTARARRRAERQAVFQTLEQFGLAEIRRGKPELVPVNAEELT